MHRPLNVEYCNMNTLLMENYFYGKMKNSIRHFKQYEIEGRENVTTKYDKTTTAVYKKKFLSIQFNVFEDD